MHCLADYMGRISGILSIVAFGVAVRANPTVIQPTEATSKDVFVYQGIPTINFNGGGFETLLASGLTSTGHDQRSFVQFDLPGASINAGEIATLNLWVGSTASAGFGVNPSPTAPVTTDIRERTGIWDESTVTWNSQPPTGANIIANHVINGINQWVSFDVTTLVQSWIANTTPNNGFAVLQDAIVTNGGPVIAVYDSASGANRPFLEIGPVPEPSVLLVGASFAVGLLARRPRHP